jgi:integrase/recombinase XerD
MSPVTGPLAHPIDAFLQHKRGLGYAYKDEERLLRVLDHVAAEAHLIDPIIDESLVRRFVASAPRGSRSHYLSVIRQLALHLTVVEPRTFVPPPRFLNARRNQSIVRLLSRQESARFLDACDQMVDHPRFPLRRLSHGTLLRVLLLTGLRRGEALALKVSDVDLVSEVIHVRCGKFGKSRFVPVAPDLGDRLRSYDVEFRDSVAERSAEDAFFPGPDGRSVGLPSTLYRSFRMVLVRAAIPHGGRGEGPRLHDLRHSFAVFRLLSWYEQEVDLGAKLPLLATYLGHIGLETSQIYLHMTHDLVGEVTRRVEARFSDIITTEVTP